ncbi:WecB/TagA/CpsF family glycosyltransferase [Gluconacetobacter johannae DSM 13595]|uniref:WecB/TagA/CpsF family glycosyltransferase n=1 Tax=Gluconacetobacter johannae TaxID=112140 RepID=A0A7W4J5W0_9PROT|nr:WecB/TagA/CpsF family glycosyltransferase [Gluconacetobacter johannae]MBB2175007.1 WecB/TagA/CpsF family glycosyltransferase [Gluconacetobacter johannae]GBQ87363.1 WecB/TagA/CpsF family glycosyltransferase [Gluconacetobacter johannae DSM 13595]
MPSDVISPPARAADAPRDASPPFDALRVMGLRLLDIPRDALADTVAQAARRGGRMLVVNANAHCVVLSQRERWLRDLFDRADIAFCDGAGVQLAAAFLIGRRPHRTTPPEWIGPVLQQLGRDASLFWLGGTQDTAEHAARTYEQRYGVRTAGVRNGFFDARPGSADSEDIVRQINATRPTLLLVNMGMPRQERWLYDHWDRLPPTIAITAGALVDHAAGRVRRPPRWVANMGLEWLVRLVREPRRLWRRYLLGLPVFGLHVLRWKIRPERPQA